MAYRHYSKLWGLKKLRLMARGSREWFCSPHKVYVSTAQFRVSHARGSPRLLVRTDEEGRVYKRFKWEEMPRQDVLVPQEGAARSREREVRGMLKRVADGHTTRVLGKKRRFIVHPTGLRKDIRTYGSLRYFPEKSGRSGYLSFGLAYEPAEADTVIMRSPKSPVLNFTFGVRKNGRRFSISGWKAVLNMSKAHEKGGEISWIAGSLLRFFRRGLEGRQLKVGRAVEIHFLTWRDDPQRIEFFDLLEQRAIPDKRVGRDSKLA